ncbi:hypothetical protein J6590_085895, partial [Homalodisca vitripennis]
QLNTVQRYRGRAGNKDKRAEDVSLIATRTAYKIACENMRRDNGGVYGTIDLTSRAFLPHTSPRSCIVFSY